MVTTRSEALRGPWGDQMREPPEGGESSSRPSPTLEILNERIAQMENEMYELEKKNAELQQHHGEDSNSATPQPVEGEEQGEETQPNSQGGRKERKKNHNAVDQKPRKNRTSKRMDKKLKEIIEKLEQRCDLLTEAARHQHSGGTSRAGDLLQKSASPFADRVASFRLPEKFKVPDIKTYTGQEDPMEHLDNYRAHLELKGTPDEVACRAFPLTLSGNARDWYRRLPPKSIQSFDEFGKMFVTQFMAGVVRKKPAGTLMSIQQGRDESLKEFLQRFNQARLTTESLTEEFVHSALYQGIRKDGPLMADLARKPTRYLHEFMERADEFINQEETLRALLGKATGQTSNQGDKPRRKKEFHKKQKVLEPGVKKKFQDYNWTPLNAPIEEVLAAIKVDPMYEKPAGIVGTPHPRTADHYCSFHKSKGHSTENCRSLRALIEKFIRNGKLVRFLEGQRGPQGFDRNPRPEERRNQPQRYREEPRERMERPRDRDREPNNRPADRDRRERSRSQARLLGRENLREIHTISGGFGGGGDSSAARKAYARHLKEFKIYSVQKPPKTRKYEDLLIGFSNEDFVGVSLPHSDALVVTLAIANHKIHRVLVDTGSFADIIYKSAFELMSIGQGKLVPVKGPLVGFSGEQVLPIGSIDLPVMAGTSPQEKTVMVKFLVVDGRSAYNVILGRPALNDLGAVTSTPYLCMKFPTSSGVGVVRGD
jgi:hypothetical protein